MIRLLKAAAAASSILIFSCAQPFYRAPENPLVITDIDGPAPLRLDAPITRFDEAIPLGNGILGGLLWGEENIIKLSLDRGDLWDLRKPEMLTRADWNYKTLQKLVAAGDQSKIVEMFDAPYDTIPYPTKLPAGRIEFTFPTGSRSRMFELDLARAQARADLGNCYIEGFFHADRPVAMLRARGARPDITMIAPAAVQKLGYPAAETGERGGVRYYLQKTTGSFSYCAAVGEKRDLDTTIYAVSIATNAGGADPVESALQQIHDALDAGYERYQKSHESWWERFWKTSRLRVPNVSIQKHYDIVKYYYGAASRAPYPPMPLQGLWTADDGGLPPWKGDYHNDLNTQMTYLACHEAGLVDCGLSFINFNWNLLPRYQQFAKEFYQVPGAVVPGVMSLDGAPLGGWGQYSLSPTQGAWIAHSFYLHWKFTNNHRFLAERAYPFCEQIGIALEALLSPGADGKLALPLSTSPEIFDNSLKAWLAPNSNYDLALLKFIFSALGEMADALDRRTEAARWRGALDRLGDFTINSGSKSLAISRGVSFDESHRHFSHSLAIYPLGLLMIDGPFEQNARATVDEIERRGTAAWCGYSFSWMACLAARLRDAERALHYLNDFERAFISRNGFHLNGDQTKSGLSNFTYRPFTLEGNFLAMQAVHEMVLQSAGSVIRIFPAMPSAWKEGAFRELRAEGGFVVSADYKNGAPARVSIRCATGNAKCYLKDPFDGKGYFNIHFERSGDLLIFTIPPGQSLFGESALRDSAPTPFTGSPLKRRVRRC